MLPEVIEATIVCRSTTPTRSSARSTEHDVAAIILEPIPHNIGAVLPQPGFLERLRELATKHGTVLIFDEVITGFRHALGGYQSIAGVTPDLTTMGKAMGNGWPVSALGGKAELMDLFSHDARPARVLRRHVQRPSADDAPRRSRRSTSCSASRCTSTSSALGERARARACASCTRASACRRTSAASARSSSPTSSKAPPTSYDDLLANDVDLFIGYRRELMKHGIFELPLNLKRSHFSYAHTDDDVDRLLEATEEAVTTVPARPRHERSRGHAARSTSPRPASRSGACSSRRSRTPPAGPTTFVPIATIANGDGPTVLVSAGNHGDEYEGQIAALRLIHELEPEQVHGPA